MKGHAYFLYHPTHVGAAARVDADQRCGVYLIGDSLGLAHPLTAEGILPSVISGRLAAEAILGGAPRDYPARLAAHPVLADYRRLSRAMALRRGRAPAPSGRLAQRAMMNGFAWMFSGARLPVPKIIDVGLEAAERWLARAPVRKDNSQ
jgi:flavin-dependent dehydrogenase